MLLFGRRQICARHRNQQLNFLVCRLTGRRQTSKLQNIKFRHDRDRGNERTKNGGVCVWTEDEVDTDEIVWLTSSWRLLHAINFLRTKDANDKRRMENAKNESEICLRWPMSHSKHSHLPREHRALTIWALNFGHKAKMFLETNARALLWSLRNGPKMEHQSACSECIWAVDTVDQ